MESSPRMRHPNFPPSNPSASKITPWANTALSRDPDSMSMFSDTSTVRSDSEESVAVYKGLTRRNGVSTHGRSPSSSSSVFSEHLAHKPLPSVPRDRTHHLTASRHPSIEVTPVDLLAKAIGEDNVIHTSELDTVPCSGIRIPIGPLSGLLAWRFVVRLPIRDTEGLKYRRGSPRLQNNTMHSPHDAPTRRRSTEAMDLHLFEPQRPFAMSEARGHHERSKSQVDIRTFSSVSAGARPSFPHASASASASASSLRLHPSAHPLTSIGHEFRSTSALSFYTHPPTPTITPNAVVTNFLLDTSCSYNTISRETLMALGVNESVIETLERAESERRDASKPTVIALSIQNIPKPITFRLAAEGQPGRLGVQFLEESRVNVCIGEGGRGGIVWADPTPGADGFLREVPRTIPFKSTFQSKVLAFFGRDS